MGSSRVRGRRCCVLVGVAVAHGGWLRLERFFSFFDHFFGVIFGLEIEFWVHFIALDINHWVFEFLMR